jgi:hypothetical protein
VWPETVILFILFSSPAFWYDQAAIHRLSSNKENFVANFNPEHKAVLDDLLLGHPAVRPGRMFGFPAYYAGRKLCICLYEEGVGLKIPEQTAVRLLKEDPHVIPFQPYGKRIMREWIQINVRGSEEYRQYQAVFEESIEHVLAQQEQVKS